MHTDTKPQPPPATTTSDLAPTHHPDPRSVQKAIEKRSFATVASTSPAGRPHVAGVLFKFVDDALYVNTLRTSRKARNIAANPHVAVCIPVRRLPVGPPSTIQFQAKAEVLDLDDPEIKALLEAGQLDAMTKHGELDMADGCFLRIIFGPRVVTYGLGMSIPKLIGDPLHAGGSVELERSA